MKLVLRIFYIILFGLGKFCVIEAQPILPGAYQTSIYLPKLVGKRVGIFANQTSTIGKTHLVDTLKKRGINITKIFAPEHGFRGVADAGEHIENMTDKATGIPVIGLYGKKNKPNAADLSNVDVLVFDIQDVGVRFYTFISSLQYLIETAIEFNKPIIVLDRPNPNGFYIDGPVLEPEYASFVGLQPIPIVYGMTIGEYAKMLLGEKMLPWKYIRKEDNHTSLSELLGFAEEHKNFSLTVVPCKNYTHKKKYILPIKPSPNLPDMASIYWYPSNALFEGTVISEGRGTAHPFCIIGHPSLPDSLSSFIPTAREGAKNPKHVNKVCHGWNVYEEPNKVLEKLKGKLALQYLVKSYALFPLKDSFFIKPSTDLPVDFFFNKLSGNRTLMSQITSGQSIEAIRQSWQPALAKFKAIRKKYLLYPDFY